VGQKQQEVRQKDGTSKIVKGNVMKIKKIKQLKDRENVYDIRTESHNYIMTNGVVSHNTMDQYNPLAIAGGRGLYFACSSIVLGSSKSRHKATQSDTEVLGALILATTKKSRFCKELTKLRYLIKYEGGIHPYYGLMEDALEGGYIDKPSMGYYSRPCVTGDKKWREREVWDNAKEFWTPILTDTDFAWYIEKKYTFMHSQLDDEDFDIDMAKLPKSE